MKPLKTYLIIVLALFVLTGPARAQDIPFKASPQMIPKQEVKILETGSKAPDFNLPGADGKFYKLSDFEGKALLIVFTANHCPTAQAYEERLKQLTADYADKGVAVIAISPNSPLGVFPEELGYTDLDDTYEAMQIRARDQDFNFPYLYDGDDHAVSLQYGPVATPHAYVFDKEHVLRYTGRIDSREKPGTGQAEDVRAALDAVLKGEAVAEPVTKTFGCSTKWAWMHDGREKSDKEWEAREIRLDEIGEAGIRDLLKNDSENLRLINVWATWCGPCVMEYPEFIRIQRWYNWRDFEFVSISADEPGNKARVEKFLRDKKSAVRNYIFTGKDKYALMEAIDPEWEGALPYTLLVEPGGKVVHRVPGPIDPLELRRTIVEHPMMGRVY